jgi:hypothetical protein
MTSPSVIASTPAASNASPVTPRITRAMAYKTSAPSEITLVDKQTSPNNSAANFLSTSDVASASAVVSIVPVEILVSPIATPATPKTPISLTNSAKRRKSPPLLVEMPVADDFITPNAAESSTVLTRSRATATLQHNRGQRDEDEEISRSVMASKGLAEAIREFDFNSPQPLPKRKSTPVQRTSSKKSKRMLRSLTRAGKQALNLPLTGPSSPSATSSSSTSTPEQLTPRSIAMPHIPPTDNQKASSDTPQLTSDATEQLTPLKPKPMFNNSVVDFAFSPLEPRSPAPSTSQLHKVDMGALTEILNKRYNELASIDLSLKRLPSDPSNAVQTSPSPSSQSSIASKTSATAFFDRSGSNREKESEVERPSQLQKQQQQQLTSPQILAAPAPSVVSPKALSVVVETCNTILPSRNNESIDEPAIPKPHNRVEDPESQLSATIVPVSTVANKPLEAADIAKLADKDLPTIEEVLAHLDVGDSKSISTEETDSIHLSPTTPTLEQALVPTPVREAQSLKSSALEMQSILLDLDESKDSLDANKDLLAILDNGYESDMSMEREQLAGASVILTSLVSSTHSPISSLERELKQLSPVKPLIKDEAQEESSQMMEEHLATLLQSQGSQEAEQQLMTPEQRNIEQAKKGRLLGFFSNFF